MFLGLGVRQTGRHTSNLFFSDQNASLLRFLLDAMRAGGAGPQNGPVCCVSALVQPGLLRWLVPEKEQTRGLFTGSPHSQLLFI